MAGQYREAAGLCVHLETRDWVDLKTKKKLEKAPKRFTVMPQASMCTVNFNLPELWRRVHVCILEGN